jgi:1-phosphofructokinase
MILTVTPNPSLDRTVIVPGFRAGRTNRGTVDRVEFGGKGINVARTLRHLGCEVIATGFLPFDYADAISDALRREGVNTDFVAVPGITRVNFKLIDPSSTSKRK